MLNFPEYHKIQGLYKRDDKGNFILGDYSLDCFRYLENSVWQWTEKVDGTNIRIYIDPKVEAQELSDNISPPFIVEPEITIGGHHNNSQIPPILKFNLDVIFGPDNFDRMQDTLEGPVVLYGEGFGGKIQSGHGIYGYPLEPSFILFDVWVPDSRNRIGGYWLDYDSVSEIAIGLNIPQVPTATVNGSVIGLATLKQAVYDVRYHGIPSLCGRAGAQAEGIVGTPKVPLFDRRGRRIITKLKAKDFDFLKGDTTYTVDTNGPPFDKRAEVRYPVV